ncbi:hypothetical protein [Scytonema sp. NUACC26]|uniref:hypothetical protein n=1 Tax=Scytonema sp. NUACC26 TaxID=3140176 RepID=UPI0034DC4293
MHGTVVGLQARINIILRSSGRSDVEIECVVDTGFEGTLTLPPHIIAYSSIEEKLYLYSKRSLKIHSQ